MDTSERAATQAEACGVVNRLIVACKDAAGAQTAASARMLDIGIRDVLTSLVSRRELFAIELSELVRELGGEARVTGSSWGRANVAIHSIRSKLGGLHEGDTLGTSARVEATIERAYELALRQTLPAHVRVILARQHAEIDHDRAELRRAWFLH